MIIAFAGHRQIADKKRIREIVKGLLIDLICEDNEALFYLGGYGDFDNICAAACAELKEQFPNIERVYVTPYLTTNVNDKINEMQSRNLCDSTVYPPIENVPPRFAISRRNEWVMSRADVVIAYIKHNFGGAYKAVLYARRKEKRVINIFDM